MINYETLNALIECGALLIILLYFVVLGYLFFKVFNYKPHKDVEDVIKNELLETYYLKRQLECEKTKRKQNYNKQQKILQKIEKQYSKLQSAQVVLKLTDIKGGDNCEKKDS